jgi:hypothetical protein
VAAGGCPASPPWLRGRCEGQPRGCGGRGLGGPPGPPTVWVAGLTADLSKMEGEVGQMRGFPLVGGFLRASAASRWSGGRGPWVGASGLPGHLMIISDVYWIISDALSHHIPRQGRPPGLSGGCASRGHEGAACRGPPVVRERSGII